MTPAKIIVCKCKHCKAAKKRKSTKLKKRVKRLINKQRRTLHDCIKVYMWA